MSGSEKSYNEGSNDLRPSSHHVLCCTSGGSEGRPPHPTTAKFDIQTFGRDSDGRGKYTHQVDATYSGVLPHIFGNTVIFHPITNDLERWHLGGNSEEGDNVGMPQPLPYDDFFVERLPGASMTVELKK